MPIIAISGAGSGIGHEFLDYFSSDSSNTIHAIDVSWSDEVSDSKSAATVIRHTVDTSSRSALDKLNSEIGDGPIDLFIHSAAVRGLVKQITEEKPDDPGAAETLDVVDKDTMMMALQINVLGSFMLIRALIPNLKAGQGKCVVMGSRMGSVESNKVSARLPRHDRCKPLLPFLLPIPKIRSKLSLASPLCRKAARTPTAAPKPASTRW